MVSQDLNQRIQEAALIYQAPAVSVAYVADDNRRQVDWRRFLSGGKLASPEIACGIAIPRRLQTRAGDEVALAGMLEWIRQQQGRTILLSAEAGEGKSTYLRSLAAGLRDTAIVLDWDTSLELDLDDVIGISAMVRSVHESPDGEPLPTVVCAELGPDVGPEVAYQVLATLRDHESGARDVVVILAGRPPVVEFLAQRVGGAVLCGLATIDSNESLALCETISRAYTEIAKTMPANQILDQFPNLISFCRLARIDQSAYFSESAQPLIIGFLQAVYGDDFVNKLVNEYDVLGHADKHAYLHVCFATLSGIDLPERNLLMLAPDADLDGRSRQDPWLRNDSDEHFARHPVIAKAVVEGCNNRTAFEKCFTEWIGLSRAQPKTMRLLFQLVSAIAYMQPLRTGNEKAARAVKRRLINALEGDTSLVSRIEAESNGSAARLLSWGLRLRSLLPPSPDKTCIELLETIADVFSSAKDRAADSTLTERIEYNQESVRSDLTALAGWEESVDVLEERIGRWRSLLGREWAGAKLFADLFDTSADLAELLTTDRQRADLAGDSDASYLAYVTAGQSYTHLYSIGGPASEGRWRRCGELINRLMYQGLPTRYIDALGEIWTTCQSLRSNPQIGVLYTRALLDLYKEGRRTDESLPDRAISVLKDVLSIDPGREEAVYELAALSALRRENIPFVREQINNAPRGNLLAEATMYHASALIADEQEERRKLLELAADSYSRVDWTPLLWDVAGTRWEQCCTALRGAGSTVHACGPAFQRARNEFRS